MADVYENASITIAATWADNTAKGCFSRTPTQYMAQPVSNTGLFVRRMKPLFPRQQEMGNNLCDHGVWPLLSRAWVYQERKLSARVVHFGKEQLYWECEAVFCSEDGFERPQEARDLKSGSMVCNHPNLWRSVVKHYSRLSLTYDSDRLPAVSALVKRIQPYRKGDVYIAGLWRESLLNDLGWLANPPQEPRPDISLPTWSWASVKTGIQWPDGQKVLTSARLTSVSYEITGPAHIGLTTHASIAVLGRTGPVNYSISQESSSGKFVVRDREPLAFNQRLLQSKRQDFLYCTARPPIRDAEFFALLFLFSSDNQHIWERTALVLRTSEHGQHNRVGLFRLRYEWVPGTEITGKQFHSKRRRLNELFDALPTKQFTMV